MLDVDSLRAETPGVQDHVHFNNAGASLPTMPVLERQIEHLRLEAQIGGSSGAEVAGEHASVRDAVATLIGAEAGEIALHQSATDARKCDPLGRTVAAARRIRWTVRCTEATRWRSCAFRDGSGSRS